MTREYSIVPKRIKKLSYSCLMIWLTLYTAMFFLDGIQCQQGGGKGFYELLEIGREASKAEIKKQWRKLSVKYHPDKNPGDEEAGNYYRQINRAYEVLSDDEKRNAYDQAGEEGVDRLEGR